MDPDYKVCKKCGQSKPTVDFSKRARSKDGLNYYCKTCIHSYRTSETARIHARARKQKPEVRIKSIEYAKKYNPKYYQNNKDKYKSFSQKFMQGHPDKKYEYNAKYRKSAKGKAAELKYKQSGIGRNTARRNRAMRRSSGYVSPEKWTEMIESVGNTCILCGKYSDKFHIDHWIPVSRGGKTEIGNLIPICATCNHKKLDREPVSFVLFRFGIVALLRIKNYLEGYL